MNNSQEQEDKVEIITPLNSEEPTELPVGAIRDESTIDEEDSLYSESLLREIIASYEGMLNSQNDKYEYKYNVTLTTQKVPTKEGNKDVAYLRLEKATRSKAAIIEDPNLPNELKLPEWTAQLVHAEAYPFRNVQERINPKQLWKDYLFQSCIARLVAAGLEYAELMHRMKKTNLEEERRKEEAGKNLDLVITDKMPRPLNEDELKYKEEISKLRAQENGKS